jgi:ectoine utilization protein EutC
MAPMYLISEAELRRAVTLSDAIPAMEEAFVTYSQKRATVPPVVQLDVPENRGEIHVKAGHIHGASEYVIKIAAGFYDNPERNLPVGSGLMMVFDSVTGFPLAMLLDNGFLTELRTAAAGAVAAKYMAPQKVDQVGIIGAGVQGRFQLESLAQVRHFRRVRVYDHHTKNVTKYLSDMQPKFEAQMEAASTSEDAVRGSNVIITATPSRKPILLGEWIGPRTHITAMGSDSPDKQELDTSVLARADRIIADSVVQCVIQGEIHHAVKVGILKDTDVDGELGDVISGKVPGRLNDEEITICDLTGVGVQDAAIAKIAYQKARSLNLGREIQV